MREILFRGKRVDNGEWVEGYLVVADNLIATENKLYIIESGAKYYLFGEFDPVTEVIPETVGQYTGLTDKNGKKIFEGDIVRCDILPFLKRVIVEFFDGAFVMNTTGNHIKAPLYHYCHRTEVIGNVIDNRELLEVELRKRRNKRGRGVAK